MNAIKQQVERNASTNAALLVLMTHVLKGDNLDNGPEGEGILVPPPPTVSDLDTMSSELAIGDIELVRLQTNNTVGNNDEDIESPATDGLVNKSTKLSKKRPKRSASTLKLVNTAKSCV